MNDVIEACKVLKEFCASQSNCSYCPIDETCGRRWEQRSNLADVMKGFIHEIKAHTCVKDGVINETKEVVHKNICSRFANCQECIFADSDECPYSMLETYIDEYK